MRRIIKKFAVVSIFVLFLLSVIVPNIIIETRGEEQFDLDDFMQQILEEYEEDSIVPELPLAKFDLEQEYDDNYTYYIPSQVVVGFKPNIDVSTIESYEGHDIIDKIEILNIALLEVEEDHELEYIDYLKHSNDVYFAELNTVLCALHDPNDEKWNDQYGPQLIECPTAWDTETGDENIAIAILDTGVNYNHPDLENNIWINPGEDLNGNGIVDPSDFNDFDDDNNGFVDDIRGWDFYYKDNDPDDDDPHGTNCAGIAAAEMDNWIGIAGVSQGSIQCVKVLSVINNRLLGTLFKMSRGIIYAAGFDEVWIMSMSLGVRFPSPLLTAVCGYAYYIKNILLVAAAGGHPHLENVLYPAHIRSVIAVAAVDEDKNVCDFSPSGPQIELAAPGEDIITTDYSSSYSYISGTSMATPHVAGVAHLYYSKQLHNNPSYQKNWQNLKLCRDKLQKTAEDIDDPGKDIRTGWGLVRADRIVTKNIIYCEVVGEGSVSFSPNQAFYDYNSVVQITANPSSGWSFEAWSGDLSSTASIESITVDEDKYITAIFTE